MHRCAEIHNAMSGLTGNANKTSEQHCELRVARMTRDVKDLQIIHSWFTENYPFQEKAELKCISTGLNAPKDYDIICNRANEIGAKIQQSLSDQTYTSAKALWKKKIVTLATLHSTLNIGNEVVNINPLILFSRLILLAEREENATPCVEYGLTNYPFSLCKDGMMRSNNKTSLQNYLTKGLPKVYLPTEIVQVIDRGALLCQVRWCLYTKFSDIYKSSKRHLYRKFGYCYVVFDGYGNGPSPKDMQNIKRSGTVSPNITFTSNIK